MRFIIKKMCGALAAAFLLGASIAAVASISLLVQARESTAADSTAVDIKIDNFTFAPQRLTVRAGTTVTWQNRDDIPHAIASVTRAFKSQALDTDDTYTFTLTSPGIYEYFCSLHPQMTGTIVVEGQTASNATP
jgi:plastocyanin